MIPKAFRVFDFKSIRDSGVCQLSGDGITVLAGQNESGKTALLSSLRDFDLKADGSPQTADYRPDDRFDARPRVAVQFAVAVSDIQEWLDADGISVPRRVLARIADEKDLWITRDLDSGKFSVQENLLSLWTEPDEGGHASGGSSETKTHVPISPADFAAGLRDYWPSFVYFDSFEDILPRSVAFDEVKPAKKTAQSSVPKPTAAQSVLDFVTLADIDLDVVEKYAEQDKSLSNYLSSRGTSITGDFLSYWKQRTDGEQTVDLRVQHHRDAAGELQLAFYVHDKSDQYPEQRSRGFLWFLSFYLRLAAARKRDPDRKRVLLIDEPGTHLHARAQRDVLHLLEDRLSRFDQIIYSTHSPYLIPTEKLHRLRIAIKDAKEGTLILDRLTHPRLRGEGFRDTLSPILTAIGLDIRGALEFVKKKNLLVEGISDCYYI